MNVKDLLKSSSNGSISIQCADCQHYCNDSLNYMTIGRCGLTLDEGNNPEFKDGWCLDKSLKQELILENILNE